MPHRGRRDPNLPTRAPYTSGFVAVLSRALAQTLSGRPLVRRACGTLCRASHRQEHIGGWEPVPHRTQRARSAIGGDGRRQSPDCWGLQCTRDRAPGLQCTLPMLHPTCAEIPGRVLCAEGRGHASGPWKSRYQSRLELAHAAACHSRPCHDWREIVPLLDWSLSPCCNRLWHARNHAAAGRSRRDYCTPKRSCYRFQWRGYSPQVQPLDCPLGCRRVRCRRDRALYGRRHPVA